MSAISGAAVNGISYQILDQQLNGKNSTEIELAKLGADHSASSPNEDRRAEPNRITRFFMPLRKKPLAIRVTRDLPIAIKGVAAFIKFIQSQAWKALLAAFTSESSDGWTKDPRFIRATALGRSGAGVIGAISAGYLIGEQTIELIDEIKKGRVHEAAEAGLQVVEAANSFVESIAVTASGLQALGAVAATAVAWASPVSMVCAFAALISIPINALKIRKCKQISQKLDTGDYKEWLKGVLSDHKKGDGECFVTRYFGIAYREKYAAQIQHILAEKPKEAEEELRVALKSRISDKIQSHKLKIISAIIGVIGVAVIFFVAPVGAGAFSIGLAIIAISGVFSFAAYYKERNSTIKLEKLINRLSDFEKIEPEWIKSHAPYAIRDIKPKPLMRQLQN